jgi:membrane protease YdiL (CAAX protease family)
MNAGPVRPPRTVPLRAILVFLAVVGLLRIASAHPSRSILLRPDILGAALFLYTPFLHYRKGNAPSWTRLGDPKRCAVLFLALGAAGVAVYFLVSRLPFFPASPPGGSAAPPLAAFLLRQGILVALPEEVFFRGYLYDAFAESGWEPVTATALLFAAGHLVIHASAYRALTFFPALLFGWARKKSGAVHVPAALHLLFNLFPYLRGG